MSSLAKPLPEWVGAASEETGPERLVAAAIRHDGRIYTGPRHRLILGVMARDGHTQVTARGEMGFVTSAGRFLDRAEAGQLALANGQAPHVESSHGELSSEEVWLFTPQGSDGRETVRCYPMGMTPSPSAPAPVSPHNREMDPLRRPLSPVVVVPSEGAAAVLDRAAREGYEAGLTGRGECAYPVGSPERASFESGRHLGECDWKAQRDEAYAREPAPAREPGLDY